MTPASRSQPPGEIRIGVSTCLLGEKVRYDGGHKRDPFLTEVLSRFVTFVPVCPEVEIGLGIPRETIRLEAGPDGTGVRLRAPRSGRDLTRTMQAYARRRVRELEALNLCGYILKKGSPSCGMERVRVTTGPTSARRDGRGLFAAALLHALPLLPVEEEGRLHDARLRENFYERVFAYRRLQGMFRPRWTRGELVTFHTREKLLLMSHDPPTYRELGRLVATARQHRPAALATAYREIFMRGMSRKATLRKHVNVLQHVLGYFKKTATTDDRHELAALIEDYRQGLVPLIVPITLIRHLVRRYEIPYLQDQSYLHPHPKELLLRNHV